MSSQEAVPLSPDEKIRRIARNVGTGTLIVVGCVLTLEAALIDPDGL